MLQGDTMRRGDLYLAPQASWRKREIHAQSAAWTCPRRAPDGWGRRTARSGVADDGCRSSAGRAGQHLHSSVTRSGGRSLVRRMRTAPWYQPAYRCNIPALPRRWEKGSWVRFKAVDGSRPSIEQGNWITSRATNQRRCA